MSGAPPHGLCLLVGIPISIFALVALLARWLSKTTDTGMTREQAIKNAYEYNQEFGHDCEAQYEVLDTLKLGKDEQHIGWKMVTSGVRDVPVTVKGTFTDRYKDKPIQGQNDF